ncbi:oxidoreductase-like protein [Xylaria palmicola]|nr:oxidoreductase-like protein [Xylaria palmicola]
MPPNMRPLMRVARLQSAWSSRTPQFPRAFASQGTGVLPGGTPGESSEQAMPLGPYYESILTKPQPIPEVKPEEPPTSSPKAPPTPSPKSPRSAGKKGGQKSRANGNGSSTKSSSSSSGTATSTTTTAANATAAATAATTVPPQPTAEPATAQEKARIIFGSRLAGPAERADRLQSIRDRSVVVAGVLVPPRPEEPDNCCMSGCVNCVWDQYRDELEEWAAASTRAEASLQTGRAQGAGVGSSSSAEGTTPAAPAGSMDDDGSGSETNRRTEELAKTDRPKIAKDLWDDDLYSNVPVGIREFMKHEKKLKKKHEEEGTLGG